MTCSPFCPFASCPECAYRGGESLPVGRAVTGRTGRLGSAPNGAAPAGNRGLTTDCMGVTMADSQHTDRTSIAAPLDGCPACMTRDNAPREVERPDANTLIGHYVCRACGQDWTCSWWEAVS